MGKKDIPRDVTQAALYLVRGQSARRQRYNSRWAAIMQKAKTAPGVKDAEGLRALEAETEAALARLENLRETQIMRAVYAAADAVGADLPRPIREKLYAALWKNCEDGRRWRYEVLDVPSISRAEFYRRKRDFLRDVAEKCGIW